jgi:type VI secretion system protein ImpH
MADAAGQSTDALDRRLPDPERLPDAERLRDLETRVTRYEFFAALRLIECAAPDAPRLGRSARAAGDPVRLGQVPSMAFAPAMLAEAARLGDGRLWLGGAFFGLFGPNGPLPLHLTEYALGRRHNFRDPTMARFADIFHHRLLCLLYRGWADTEPTVHGDRPASDRFKMYLGALAGVGQPALRERDAMPDAAKLHHAGYLSAQIRNPEGLCAMLADFFGERVRIEEFRGEWMRLGDEDRLYLGRSRHAGCLGSTATLGAQVWGAQSRFRVVLGSMPFERFERFLPGSAALKQLSAIVRNFVGLELAWDLKLLVDRAQVPGVRLGCGARLGWSSWLAARQRACDAGDVILADGALN